MNKQVKGIVGLGLVLAVLGGGFAFLKFTEPDDEQGGDTPSVSDPSKPQGGGITIVTDSKTEGGLGVVKSAVVKNESGEIKIKMIEEPDENGVGAKYSLEGYDDVKIDTSLVGTLINNGNGLESTSLIEENCTNKAKFGLEKPVVTVEFKYESGGTEKFYIGDSAPSNNGLYVMAEGNDTVYTASGSSLANYKKELKEFIDKTMLEEPAEEDMPRIDSLKIEREDLKDGAMVLKYDKSSEDNYSGGTSATHIMTEPFESYLSGDKTSSILTNMFGLYAKGIYSVHCKESDIAGAGLKDPYCKVTMKCNDGKTYVLLLSELFKNDDGDSCCYGMFEGGNVIYIISESKAVWLSLKPVDIASRIMITSYVWNITDVNASSNDGTSESFVIKSLSPDKEKSELKTEDFAVTRNGEEFDTERYRKFYAFLVSGNLEEFADDAEIPDSEPLATVSYTDSYSKKTYTLDFYEDSVMRALIAVNGESRYYCSRAFVKTLTENIRRIETGEDFVTTW
ncbi:MAG: DUF4340 domain-containing protein [Ruminococcus sp.]|nr:DUF4340 domain-containing protein [Ruminococcus sp.]